MFGTIVCFFFSGFKILWTKNGSLLLKFMKTYSLHRTRPRQRRLGNHGNERSKQNIKKIKETFFSFKKKGLSENMRFDISLENNDSHI